MYHISVLPRDFSWMAAKLSSGCTCTERRPEVNTNFTNRGRSASNQTSPIFFPVLAYQGKRSSVPHTFSRNRVGRRSGALLATDKTLDPVQTALQLSH